MTDECIFCKIKEGIIPSKIVYQDENAFVINDLRPRARVHLLVIPKEHIPSLKEAKDSECNLLGRLLLLLPKLAASQGGEKGFRTKIHTGRAGGQEIDHLHFHLLIN